MRAYTESAVSHSSPVFQIVPALETRPCPIGNFVVNIAGFGQALCRFEIKGGKDVVSWKVGVILSPGAALFRVQHVNGDMLRRKPLDPIQVLSPNLDPLMRQS